MPDELAASTTNKSGRLRPRKSNNNLTQERRVLRRSTTCETVQTESLTESISIPNTSLTVPELPGSDEVFKVPPPVEFLPTQGNLHLCLFCDQRFVNIGLLQKHTDRVHRSSGRRGIRGGCSYCGKSEKDPITLFNHIATVHSSQYYACVQCCIRFLDLSTLERHNCCAQEKVEIKNVKRTKTRKPENVKNDELLCKSPVEKKSIIRRINSPENRTIESHVSVTLCPINTDQYTATGNNPSTSGNNVTLLTEIHKGTTRSMRFRPGNKGNTILSRLGVVQRTRSSRTDNNRSESYRHKHRQGTNSNLSNFDPDFFLNVSDNVQENLTYYLDGEIEPKRSRLECTNKVDKCHITRNHLRESFYNPEFIPTLLAPDQYLQDEMTAYGAMSRILCRKRKWDPAFTGEEPPKKSYMSTTTYGNFAILDLWTQKQMRAKYDKYISKSKLITKTGRISRSNSNLSDKINLNSIYGNEQKSRNILSELGLKQSESVPDPPEMYFSGELTRSQHFACSMCGESFDDSRTFSTHEISHHPPILRLRRDSLFNRKLINPRILRGSLSCTKCRCIPPSTQLHRHMLECAGDMIRRKVRRRPFGAKRRKIRGPADRPPRLTIRRTTRARLRARARPQSRVRPRASPGDAESIQRMLADLPAKRRRQPVNENQLNNAKKKVCDSSDSQVPVTAPQSSPVLKLEEQVSSNQPNVISSIEINEHSKKKSVNLKIKKFSVRVQENPSNSAKKLLSSKREPKKCVKSTLVKKHLPQTEQTFRVLRTSKKGTLNSDKSVKSDSNTSMDVLPLFKRRRKDAKEITIVSSPTVNNDETVSSFISPPAVVSPINISSTSNEHPEIKVNSNMKGSQDDNVPSTCTHDLSTSAEEKVGNQAQQVNSTEFQENPTNVNQPPKYTKVRRGLNDCIAMLRDKLSEKSHSLHESPLDLSGKLKNNASPRKPTDNNSKPKVSSIKSINTKPIFDPTLKIPQFKVRAQNSVVNVTTANSATKSSSFVSQSASLEPVLSSQKQIEIHIPAADSQKSSKPVSNVQPVSMSTQTSALNHSLQRKKSVVSIPDTSANLNEMHLNFSSISENSFRNNNLVEQLSLLPKAIIDVVKKFIPPQNEELLKKLPVVLAKAVGELNLSKPSTETNCEHIPRTSEIATQTVDSICCPPEFINVDTDNFLIDPTTGAIAARGPEPEPITSTSDIKNPEIIDLTAEDESASKPNPLFKIQTIPMFSSASNKIPLLTSPPCTSTYQHKLEKGTASLRAVRKKSLNSKIKSLLDIADKDNSYKFNTLVTDGFETTSSLQSMVYVDMENQAFNEMKASLSAPSMEVSDSSRTLTTCPEVSITYKALPTQHEIVADNEILCELNNTPVQKEIKSPDISGFRSSLDNNMNNKPQDAEEKQIDITKGLSREDVNNDGLFLKIDTNSHDTQLHSPSFHLQKESESSSNETFNKTKYNECATNEIASEDTPFTIQTSTLSLPNETSENTLPSTFHIDTVKNSESTNTSDKSLVVDVPENVDNISLTENYAVVKIDVKEMDGVSGLTDEKDLFDNKNIKTVSDNLDTKEKIVALDQIESDNKEPENAVEHHIELLLNQTKQGDTSMLIGQLHQEKTELENQEDDDDDDDNIALAVMATKKNKCESLKEVQILLKKRPKCKKYKPFENSSKNPLSSNKKLQIRRTQTKPKLLIKSKITNKPGSNVKRTLRSNRKGCSNFIKNETNIPVDIATPNEDSNSTELPIMRKSVRLHKQNELKIVSEDLGIPKKLSESEMNYNMVNNLTDVITSDLKKVETGDLITQTAGNEENIENFKSVDGKSDDCNLDQIQDGYKPRRITRSLSVAVNKLIIEDNLQTNIDNKNDLNNDETINVSTAPIISGNNYNVESEQNKSGGNTISAVGSISSEINESPKIPESDNKTEEKVQVKRKGKKINPELKNSIVAVKHKPQRSSNKSTRKNVEIEADSQKEVDCNQDIITNVKETVEENNSDILNNSKNTSSYRDDENALAINNANEYLDKITEVTLSPKTNLTKKKLSSRILSKLKPQSLVKTNEVTTVSENYNNETSVTDDNYVNVDDQKDVNEVSSSLKTVVSKKQKVTNDVKRNHGDSFKNRVAKNANYCRDVDVSCEKDCEILYDNTNIQSEDISSTFNSSTLESASPSSVVPHILRKTEIKPVILNTEMEEITNLGLQSSTKGKKKKKQSNRLNKSLVDSLESVKNKIVNVYDTQKHDNKYETKQSIDESITKKETFSISSCSFIEPTEEVVDSVSLNKSKEVSIRKTQDSVVNLGFSNSDDQENAQLENVKYVSKKRNSSKKSVELDTLTIGKSGDINKIIDNYEELKSGYNVVMNHRKSRNRSIKAKVANKEVLQSAAPPGDNDEMNTINENVTQKTNKITSNLECSVSSTVDLKEKDEISSTDLLNTHKPSESVSIMTTAGRKRKVKSISLHVQSGNDISSPEIQPTNAVEIKTSNKSKTMRTRSKRQDKKKKNYLRDSSLNLKNHVDTMISNENQTILNKNTTLDAFNDGREITLKSLFNQDMSNSDLSKVKEQKETLSNYTNIVAESIQLEHCLSTVELEEKNKELIKQDGKNSKKGSRNPLKQKKITKYKNETLSEKPHVVKRSAFTLDNSQRLKLQDTDSNTVKQLLSDNKLNDIDQEQDQDQGRIHLIQSSNYDNKAFSNNLGNFCKDDNINKMDVEKIVDLKISESIKQMELNDKICNSFSPVNSESDKLENSNIEDDADDDKLLSLRSEFKEDSILENCNSLVKSPNVIVDIPTYNLLSNKDQRYCDKLETNINPNNKNKNFNSHIFKSAQSVCDNAEQASATSSTSVQQKSSISESQNCFITPALLEEYKNQSEVTTKSCENLCYNKNGKKKKKLINVLSSVEKSNISSNIIDITKNNVDEATFSINNNDTVCTPSQLSKKLQKENDIKDSEKLENNLNPLSGSEDLYPKKIDRRRKTIAVFNNNSKTSESDSDVNFHDSYLENFGIYSERRPRRSNILASKKISETFHLDSSDAEDTVHLKIEDKLNLENVLDKDKVQNDSKLCLIEVNENDKTDQNVDIKKSKEKSSISKKEIDSETYCAICKRKFRRPDNLMKHKMTLTHISKLSELEALAMEEKNKQPIDDFSLTEISNDVPTALVGDKLENEIHLNESDENFAKIQESSATEITDALFSPSKQDSENSYENKVSRKKLSHDEELFFECCSLLKESRDPCAPNQSDTVINISEKNETNTISTNLSPTELISKTNIMTSKEVIPVHYAQGSCITIYNDYQKDTVGSSTPSDVLLSKYDTHNHKNDETIVLEFNDQIDNINAIPLEILEDKFDKIKRKSRTAAAAKGGIVANQAQQSVSKRCQKSLTSKKTKSTGKKKTKKLQDSKSNVPTKGALKGFDGIKVSIPTAEIKLPENIQISENDFRTSESVNKWNNLISSNTKVDVDKRLDVYEFLDDEECNDLSFNLSLQHDRGVNSKTTGDTSADKTVQKLTVDDRCEVLSQSSGPSGSDLDDFVYMSDDYLVNPSEEEESSVSGDRMSVKSRSLSKSVNTVYKRDVIEKNAIMGKIFKSNAVRNDRKNATAKQKKKSSQEAQTDMDELFNSLLDSTQSPSPKLPEHKLNKKLSDNVPDNLSLELELSDTHHEMTEDSLEGGVARRRTRRKCAAGKQNVLVESWSSESEAERWGSGTNSSSDGIRRRAFKRSSFRRSSSRSEASGASVTVRAHFEQHGWIVGDSHKKLVTMLAHAKGRKRDDKHNKV